VGNLDNYGLMTGIERHLERERRLEAFKRVYAPATGTGVVMDYLAQTGQDVLRGADMISVAPQRYSSSIEYADNQIARGLRDVARVHTAGLGTRIFYTQHGGYDHHAQEVPVHARLLGELSSAIDDFLEDLREHDSAEEVALLVFTEFGRRIQDNGSGTDHGSGGGAFIIGENVNGGLYSQYPSIERRDWLNDEDMRHTIDFRGIYGTLLEQWMGIEPSGIVNGEFEQIQPFRKTLIEA
jgi:uncharacterized protein (DUF1501 family)